MARRASALIGTARYDDNDNESDYGSDFSEGELAAIDRLLVQANSQVASPPLAILDVEDTSSAFNAHSAIVPRSSLHRPRNNDAHRATDGGKEVVQVREAADPVLDLSATITDVPSISMQWGYEYGDEYDDNALDAWPVTQDLVPVLGDARSGASAPEVVDNSTAAVSPKVNAVSLASALRQTWSNAGKTGRAVPYVNTAQTLPTDDRPISPLTRFRSPPKKPLSVTDLVSPSWCELQYYYTLSKWGRKRPTVAMRKGSEVHRVLEEQVHRRVEVSTQTREDAWGLRLWNLIMGLRMLREDGLAREMEVWGVVHGEVIAGVIDELQLGPAEPEEPQRQKAREVDTRQKTLDPYLHIPGAFTTYDEANASPTQKIYITDVKTRSTKSIPRGASLRPTTYQLMLYHQLLSDLASDRTDVSTLFARYRLDPNATFSDAFLAHMAALEDSDGSVDFFDAPGSQDEVKQLPEHSPSSSFVSEMGHLASAESRQDAEEEMIVSPLGSQGVPVSELSSFTVSSLSASQVQSQEHSQGSNQGQNLDPDLAQYPRPQQRPQPTPIAKSKSPYKPNAPSPLPTLLSYPTLTSLWRLVQAEIALTFPHGSASLSPTLKAEYRDKNTGEVMGEHTFAFDAAELERYVSGVMSWWRGEREARGVEVEEAWKCKVCEFAEGCGWRKGREEADRNRRGLGPLEGAASGRRSGNDNGSGGGDLHVRRARDQADDENWGQGRSRSVV